MNIEDLTQEQVDQLRSQLDEAKRIKQEHEQLKAKHSQLVDDVKTLTNSGTSEEAHQGAMFRLMQSTGLYSDDQIKQMLQEDARDPDPLDDEDPTMGDDPRDVQIEELRSQIEKLERNQRSSQAATLSNYTNERVAGVSKQAILDAVRKASEERGVGFQEPSENTIRILTQDLASSVKQRILAKAKSTGTMPTQGEIDDIIKEVVPQQTTKIQSVIADPAFMRKAETVSGSTQAEFTLPEKEVPYPDKQKVLAGELDRDTARMHQDAARVDRLSRLAQAASTEQSEV